MAMALSLASSPPSLYHHHRHRHPFALLPSTHPTPFFANFAPRPVKLLPTFIVAFPTSRYSRSSLGSFPSENFARAAPSDLDGSSVSSVTSLAETELNADESGPENSSSEDAILAEGSSTAEGDIQAGPTVYEAKVAAGFFDGHETVSLKKGKGAVITDLLMVYGGLLDRPFGSGQTIAAAGGVVVERVMAEAKVLREKGEVNEQAVFELLRAVHLLEMDLQLLHAARKKETLLERLEGAKIHCKEALLIANTF